MTELVYLKKSGVHGVGLFIRRAIPKDTFIHETHMHKSLFKKAESFIPEMEWVNIKPNCLYNHSKKYENCTLVTEGPIKKLYSSKDLPKGSELYVDYTKDEDLEQPQEDWEL